MAKSKRPSKRSSRSAPAKKLAAAEAVKPKKSKAKPAKPAAAKPAAAKPKKRSSSAGKKDSCSIM